MDADTRSERRGDRRMTLAFILVVDDSNAIRRILRRILEQAGYRVAEAVNGLAALAACRTAPPDLVLLDMDMPVMDGPTALLTMRRETALTDIPVLFLTARTSGPEVAAGLKLGAQDYIRKPCEPSELVARVANALQQKRQRDALQSLVEEAGRLSTIDLLTGAGNRRALEVRTAELRAGAGDETVAGILIVDVDNFKAINDSEGHLVGDLLLRVLAARLRAAADHQHLLVRWGERSSSCWSRRSPPPAR
jgi:two-component system cell cycle response regulator